MDAPTLTEERPYKRRPDAGWDGRPSAVQDLQRAPKTHHGGGGGGDARNKINRSHNRGSCPNIN